MSFRFCYFIDPKRSGSHELFRNDSVTTRAGPEDIAAGALVAFCFIPAFIPLVLVVMAIFGSLLGGIFLGDVNR